MIYADFFPEKLRCHDNFSQPEAKPFPPSHLSPFRSPLKIFGKKLAHPTKSN